MLGEWAPWHPEASARGDCRQVHVPDVIRGLGCDDPAGCESGLLSSNIVLREVPLQHPPDSSRTEVEASSGQHLRNPYLAESGTQQLQIPHVIRHEVGELVDGLPHLNERSLALLIQALHP